VRGRLVDRGPEPRAGILCRILISETAMIGLFAARIFSLLRFLGAYDRSMFSHRGGRPGRINAGSNSALYLRGAADAVG